MNICELGLGLSWTEMDDRYTDARKAGMDGKSTVQDEAGN